MRLFLAVVLTMVAFAANSVLTRMALVNTVIDPASFAIVRVASGVLVLAVLLAARGQLRDMPWRSDFVAVAGLAAYMLGFSFAYLSIETGIGALILFGGVQITMFAGAIFRSQKPSSLQWFGSIVAFSGLVYLLAPNDISLDLMGAGLMGVAAVGWGVYSLRGQLARDPLLASGANFLVCFPFAFFVWLVLGDLVWNGAGFALAVVSGGVTSALGYALWYRVLGQLNTAIAAVAQLSVPIIAMGGGLAFLNEPISRAFVIASILVLGGVVMSVVGSKARSS